MVRREAVGEEDDGFGRSRDEAVGRDQVLYFRIDVLVCSEEGPVRPKCTGDACIDRRPIARVGSRPAVDCVGPGKATENGPQAKCSMRWRRAGSHSGRRRTGDKHGKCLKHAKKKVEGPPIQQVFRGLTSIRPHGRFLPAEAYRLFYAKVSAGSSIWVSAGRSFLRGSIIAASYPIRPARRTSGQVTVFSSRGSPQAFAKGSSNSAMGSRSVSFVQRLTADHVER